MPRYSFSVENGKPITSADATEDLADDRAAMAAARGIARDLKGSAMVMGNCRIVVRDEAGKEIGDVPLLNTVQ